MKPNKGFITVLMMVLISISLSTFSRAAFDTFSDVPNDSPFHESIFYLAERGIVCGEGNGRYVPDAPVTVRQWATMICRALGDADPLNYDDDCIRQGYSDGWLEMTAITVPDSDLCRYVIYKSGFAAFGVDLYSLQLYGYATTVGSCWLAPLVEAGEGVNMSFLVKRQSKEKILSKIAQTTMVNRSRMRDVGDTRQDYEELDICLLCGGNRLPPHRGGQRTPKLFLRRIWRKDSFGVRRNKGGGGATGVLFSVRDVDVLRLLCWCQNIRPQDLNSISTKAERENLMALGFIKLHERSGTLTLTGSGRALLEMIFNGAIPSLSLSYHGAAIERRIRLSRLMLSAYRAGIDVFASEVNVAREIPSLFLTSITRTRGRNSWGSSRVAAIVSLGGIYYAAHYVCPGIGRMAVNDELAAFHNHTNFGKNTQRAFLFAGSSYESVIEELKNQDEKRNEKLIRYGEAYHCLHAPIHLLSCDETGAQQLQIMTVPDYRVKLTRLMLRSAYQPPPEDIAAWDGLYNGHPFVIGADMDLRRIDTAVRTAKQHGCLPIALAALESQGSAVLLQRYADPGCATVYKVTENVLSELLGRAPNLYVPPRTQFLTEKGDVVDAPLIKAPGKAGGLHRK